MSSHKEWVKVVMLPWVGHGHITPFLELAKGLSETNYFICYVCSTPANLSSINNRIPAKYSSRVRLLRLDLPSSSELPPHCHTTNGLPLRLHAALGNAMRAAKPGFSSLVKALQPDLVIHDSMLPWAAAAASALKIPVVSFQTGGAASHSYFCHLGMRPGVEFPYAATLMSVSEMYGGWFGGGMESYENEREADDDHEAFHKYVKVELLVSTSRAMEGRYLDYLSHLFEKKVVSIGALVQEYYSNDDGDVELMEWLDKKQEFSSVLVSFGSEYFLKKEEIEAVANALEVSNVNFIWVVRFPKGEEMELPQGFLERVGEKGKIVEWAPQTKILNHGSIGGFVSHCGWNSFKESVCFGVPIIAMPMQHDQPLNAKLAAELGVGVEVKRDHERRFVKEEISNVINDVVGGKTGEILRRRIGELRERIRNTSRKEMDGVAHLLMQLCGKTNCPVSFHLSRL